MNEPLMTAPAAALADALSAWAAGVTLVTIADDRDDIGTTVSAFCPVSLDPPIVLISLAAGSYPAEVLSRPSLPAAGFAVTLLSASQKMLAGRFAAEGRPSARLLLDDVPHTRGELSGALIPSGGLAALECTVARRVPAGDHLLVISAVTSVVYVAEAGEPLIRFRARYPALPATDGPFGAAATATATATVPDLSGYKHQDRGASALAGVITKDLPAYGVFPLRDHGAGGGGGGYQWSRWTTSAKGRRSGRRISSSGRSAG
jgi:flavin reductase (DIM6/NTAB) family NADH-FMN oxidoreductase RutF